jgi:ABC-type antimicrobial peptide transport system permease subunit
VGIYGVLSYSVAQRTSEIGVRIALGARRVDILRMVLADGFASVAIGLACGAILAILVTPTLASMLFGVRPESLANYALIVAIVLAVSALAALLPARRAMNIDPLKALRYE